MPDEGPPPEEDPTYFYDADDVQYIKIGEIPQGGTAPIIMVKRVTVSSEG